VQRFSEHLARMPLHLLKAVQVHPGWCISGNILIDIQPSIEAIGDRVKITVAAWVEDVCFSATGRKGWLNQVQSNLRFEMANQGRQWVSQQRINFPPAFLRIPFLVYGDSPAT
jgi:hypothetical protein